MTQDEVLRILKTGANVFLTGEPGSGKTHTINQYVAYLRARGVTPAIAASTGIAATHIGGLTIHSWSGIGVRHDLTKYDIDYIAQNRTVVRRVCDARVLIIDEVSMLSARTLSMVDAVCCEIRRNKLPFGGLQTIFVGDFFQLPPVFRSERGRDRSVSLGEENIQGRIGGTSLQGQFAYHSRAWEALNLIVCYLSEQHRQEDPVFLGLLSAVRRAAVGEPHRELLRARYSQKPKDGITQLYSHNIDVDAINDAELVKLVGVIKTFDMEARGPEKLISSLKRGCLSPERLLLKIGARVMFTKNDITIHRYVNGTLGTVIGFSKEDGYPIIRTNTGRTIVVEPGEWHIDDGGRILARIIQIPLRLAWAMTVHKSQGMSLDGAHMDLSDTFEYGQGYVALSRVRTLAGLTLAGFNHKALEVHPEVRAKDAEFRARSKEARTAFGAMDGKELEAMHINFIRAIGGESGVARTSSGHRKKVSTYETTRKLLREKLPLNEMAKKRGLTVGTIINHLEKLTARKQIDPQIDLAHIELDPSRFEEMKKALTVVYQKEGKILLNPARAILGDIYSYEELRLARLFVETR